MMKKLISILLVLCLCACSSVKEPIDKSKEYITPINEVSFYEELNDTLKAKLLNIYGDDSVTNNLFEVVGKSLADLCLKDINGKTVDFKDYQDKEIVLEIVQNTCEHCKKQVPLTETILANEDIIFIQYFAWGDKEEILEFYQDAKREIPSNLIVIPIDEEMNKYVTSLSIDATPTFLLCKDGTINFACVGDLSYSKYLNAKEVAYTNPLKKADFVNNEGTSVFDLYRGYDDVINDLSNSNKDKLAKVENLEDMTINSIGKPVNFFELYERDVNPLYIIERYEKYINEPLVVFYIGYFKNNLEKDVYLVNDFAKKHTDLNILTVLMDTKDLSTSPLYKAANLSLLTDVVSSNSEIPVALLDTYVVTYPACIFIQDNIITGGLYSYESVEDLEYAYDIFIGEDSIALLNNN